jgi:hypothetical protein
LPMVTSNTDNRAGPMIRPLLVKSARPRARPRLDRIGMSCRGSVRQQHPASMTPKMEGTRIPEATRPPRLITKIPIGPSGRRGSQPPAPRGHRSPTEIPSTSPPIYDPASAPKGPIRLPVPSHSGHVSKGPECSACYSLNPSETGQGTAIGGEAEPCQ